MNVYKYDYQTKEYIGTEAALIDPLESEKQSKEVYLLPANATFTAPPAEKEGFSHVWSGEAWQEVEDNRGTQYWLPGDTYGTPAHEMKELGPLPDGATTTALEQTEDEKLQMEANATRSQLREKAIGVMMMNLVGSDTTEEQAEYQASVLALDDGVALKIPDVFPTWSGDSKEYKTGERVNYNGVLYKVLQDHTSQSTWTPSDAPSLFAKVLTSATGEPQEWQQPDSTNGYKTGDRVIYNGKIYESTIDNNVWSPEAYPTGWQEINEE